MNGAQGGRFRPHSSFLSSSENCLRSLPECVPLLNLIQLSPLLFVVDAGRRNYDNLEAPFFFLLTCMCACVCGMYVRCVCERCVCMFLHMCAFLQR